MIKHWFYVTEYKNKYEICYNDFDNFCEVVVEEFDTVEEAKTRCEELNNETK